MEESRERERQLFEQDFAQAAPGFHFDMRHLDSTVTSLHT